MEVPFDAAVLVAAVDISDTLGVGATLFKSVGTALEDLAAANLAVNR